MLASLAAQAGSSSIPVRIELLSAREIVVQAGELHPEPVRYRVTHATTGMPVQGVTFFVSVGVWYCMNSWDCPEWGIDRFGQFEGASLNEPRDLVLAPDAAGVITALPLRAGVGTNYYTIDISAVSTPRPYAVVQGGSPSVVVIQIATTPPSPRTIPALSWLALAVLVAAMVATSARQAR